MPIEPTNEPKEITLLTRRLDRLNAGLMGAITLTLLLPLCRIFLASGF